MKSFAKFLSIILSLMLCPFTTWADGSKARPGKGMDLIPGDFAEYSNKEYFEGKTTVLPSTIMMAVGTQGEFEGVAVFVVKGDELTSMQNVLYDLTKEKTELGELIERGSSRISIRGENYDCTWVKRKDDARTATFWTCPALPFEKYAKVEIELKDGRKRLTELVYFGPETTESEKSRLFQRRLEKILRQASNKSQ